MTAFDAGLSKSAPFPQGAKSSKPLAEATPMGSYTPGSAALCHWYFDAPLAHSLVKLFGNCGLLEAGAGIGRYAAFFRECGLDVEAYDGIVGIDGLSEGAVRHWDLTSQGWRPDPRPWVVCLEVMEHIPREHESTALEHLTACAERGIILSWGTPASLPNPLHVNVRENHEVEVLMQGTGFDRDVAAEKALRAHAALHWFRVSLMVYRRREAPNERC